MDYQYPRYTKKRASNVVIKDPGALFVTMEELQSGGINSAISLLVGDVERTCHVMEWTTSIDNGPLYVVAVTADVEASMYLFDYTRGVGEELIIWEIQITGDPPADEPVTTYDLVFFQPRPVYAPRSTRNEE